MRILHCCLSNFYIDDFGYQENQLPIMNQQDGHDVMIIASTETFLNSILSYVEPKKYTTKEGIPVVRLNYSRFLPHCISRKVRKYPHLVEEIRSFSPQVILFHGTGAYAIKDVAKYIEENPNVKLYVDCHEAYYNSAQNFVSKYLLHKLCYRRWFRGALPYIHKVFYIGEGEKEYLLDMMQLRKEDMEFYPLGGNVINEVDKARRREKVYSIHEFQKDTILFVHSGKLDPLKKTDSLLSAFIMVPDLRFRLLIIGSMDSKYQEVLQPLIEADDRIRYLGWKTHDELQDYLCAADMYLQPGSVSATLQNAICCGTPVMIHPHSAYDAYVQKNGIRVKNEEEIADALKFIASAPEILEDMSIQAYILARNILDYNKLAARLYV